MSRFLGKRSIGGLLAAAGLLLPIFFELPGLDLPGRIALGIFFMAACLWVTEAVPIWGTSLFVILLQVALLSDASPVLSRLHAPEVVLQTVDASAGQTPRFAAPAAALSPEGEIWRWDEATGGYRRVQVEVVEQDAERVVIASSALASGHIVAADASHWRLGFAMPRYTQYYGSLANPIVILFLGGFFLAAAAVKYGLDQNLTRLMLRVFGTSSSYVLLGLILSTAVLSAFMSNTASTAMMITVVLPIVRQLDPKDPLRIAVVLAIPCGANIGGIATPIGTPPNAVALGALAGQGIHIGFLQWMLIAVPMVVVVLFITWRALLLLFPPSSPRLALKVDSSWNLSPAAIGTYIVFSLTVLLWVTDQLHGMPAAVVAFLPIGLFPILQILDKNDVRSFSWDVLWLMAGGLSLGITMQMGPAEWMIGLIDWSILPAMGVLLALSCVAYIFSNLISNTVAAAIIIPIGISIGASGAVGGDFDLVKASIVVGVMVSFAMLLPISTPPNAIATATGVLDTKHLTRIGIAVGIVGALVTLLSSWLYWDIFLP